MQIATHANIVFVLHSQKQYWLLHLVIDVDGSCTRITSGALKNVCGHMAS